MNRWLVGLAVVVSLIGSGHADATIIFSDDFESEPTPEPPSNYIGNYNDFANWDVLGSGVDLVGPGSPHVDSIVVDLDGTSGSTLVTKRAFDLLPGMYYTLTFDLLGPVGGTICDTVVVELGSVFSESITLLRGAPFETFTRTITVTEATTGKLSFTDLGADSNGAYLDNVQLEEAVIPEPSTFAIWSLLGVIGITVGWWRRHNK